ncbi:MAG: histidine phosphatase family protein [Candidatus Rokubacteria bacterium]|nr:histidine phosphatase family protein [Candidatus Rokubacteria bacterium]
MAAHYLVRHGSARPAAPGAADAERPLDDRGREEVTRVARHAAALGLRVAEIRHSGFVRARESAEILAAQDPSGCGHLPRLRGGAVGARVDADAGTRRRSRLNDRP